MAKILINDGIHAVGLKMLQEAGHEVATEKVSQENLAQELPAFDAICVRSATKVREALIEQCPNLKVIGRGGVGLDNIDVDFAKSKDIHVVNTPAASSRSVAELAMGHLISVSRFIYKSNRNMPADGDSEFKVLKKSFSKGSELEGKTLGIIGAGRIGREMGKTAIGMGMKVVFHDPFVEDVTIEMNLMGQKVKFDLKTVPMKDMLGQADAISLHIPFTGAPALSTSEFNMMKDGVILVNAARGGTVDEDALLAALDSGKVAGAGLDVFINEPTPRKDLLAHPNVSVTPHIGASTEQAQEKIGIELAQQLIDLLG